MNPVARCEHNALHVVVYEILGKTSMSTTTSDYFEQWRKVNAKEKIFSSLLFRDNENISVSSLTL